MKLLTNEVLVFLTRGEDGLLSAAVARKKLGALGNGVRSSAPHELDGCADGSVDSSRNEAEDTLCGSDDDSDSRTSSRRAFTRLGCCRVVGRGRCAMGRNTFCKVVMSIRHVKHERKSAYSGHSRRIQIPSSSCQNRRWAWSR